LLPSCEKNAAHVRTVGLHRVELEVAVAHRGEHQRAGDRAHGRLGVVAGLLRQLREVLAVGVRDEQVVLAVDVPDVAAAASLRDRRRLGAVVVRRREQDALVALQEVGARRPALARADTIERARAQIEHEDLVRGHIVRTPLQDQAPAVARPVGLGVLAVERQLAHVAQMLFARQVLDRLAGPDLERRDRRDAAGFARLLRRGGAAR
jgi:hypothetical protein